MSIEDAKATIGEGNHSAEEAALPFHAVAAQAGDLAVALASATQGSSHETVRRGLSRLGEARSEAERVEGLLRSGVDAAREYMQVLG